MAKFVFDDIALPSGILKITLMNNTVDNNTYFLNGDWILNIAQLKEVVEDNSVGGVLKISDMELEIFDREGRIKNEILLKGTVTAAQAKILLEVEGTDEIVLYGDIDLSTVEYPSYYDDEDTKESHSCRFVVFSFLKRLEDKSLIDLRNALEADEAAYPTFGYVDTTVGVNPALMQSDASLPIGGIAWSNVIYGSQSDDLRATSTLTFGQVTRYLKATTFVNEYGSPISIESTQTIDGIEFQFEVSKTGTGSIKDSSVKFIKGGVISGNELSVGTYLTADDSILSIGSDSELGGLSWSPADISTNFGVAFSVTCDSLGLSATAQVDSVRCIITSHDTDSASTFVLVSKVVDAIQDTLGVTTSASSHGIQQLFQGGVQTNYLGLYFPYRLASGEFANCWNPTKVGSFMTLKDCKSLLMTIAGHFLSYPVLKYDVSSDTFHIELKQRATGTAFTNSQLGMLKKSTLRSFYGYDAIRAISAVTSTSHIYPANMTDDQFQLIAQRFDYQVFWGTTSVETGSANGNPGNSIYLLSGSGEMRRVTKIVDGANEYNRWRQWLLARFVAYWSNPDMYERVYKGTGIGGTDPIEILDRLTVGADDYTLTEITRDFIENEISVKMPKY